MSTPFDVVVTTTVREGKQHALHGFVKMAEDVGDAPAELHEVMAREMGEAFAGREEPDIHA
ncbi:MAG: hypothetical protein M3393_09005 [Actinomycetota bacterium]|nr:hypothetical protein [Actinomycetota bacterium]